MRQQDGQTAESTGNLTVFYSVFRLREKSCLPNTEHWHWQDQSCMRESNEMQSNLSAQRSLQPMPPQVHLSKTLSKFRPFVPLTFHITSAHLQEWLVNKIYHPLFKVHFHHIFLEGFKNKQTNIHKTISLAVLIWSVPIMLWGIVMRHSWLIILIHGLNNFSEMDLTRHGFRIDSPFLPF